MNINMNTEMDRRAASGELWTRLLGRKDGTGQLGQDSVDMTVRAGQPGRIAGTDHLSQDNRRMTTLRVQAAQDRRDRTSGTEQLEQDSKNSWRLDNRSDR
jgi:hypothetical protein